MEIDEEKVLEEILAKLDIRKERAEVARSIEAGYRSLYQNLELLELKSHMTILFDGPTCKLTVKSKKGKNIYEKDHGKKGLGGQYTYLGANIILKDKKIRINEGNFTNFPKSGDLKSILKFYSKQKSYKRNVARRVMSFITMPSQILEAANKKAETRISSGGGLNELLETSSSELFNTELIVKAYSKTPETFKELFGRATDEQKQEVVKALARQKQANKEMDAWLEEEHGEIAQYALRDQFIEGK